MGTPVSGHFSGSQGGLGASRWWEAPLVFGEELLLNLSEVVEEYAPLETKLREEAIHSPNFRVFERMLQRELSWNDTIREAFTKIVRVALAAKYSLKSVKLEESQDLIQKLVEQMEKDPALRKKALYLVFLFCRETV